jgi:hypothetical protein
MLRADRRRCEPGPGLLVPSTSSATRRVDFACGSLVRELGVRDNIVDVLGPNHRTLAKLEAPDWTQQSDFAPDRCRAGCGHGGGARGGTSLARGLRLVPFVERALR